MAWLSAVLTFLGDLVAKIFTGAMKTPAVKEKVDVEEGDAAPLPVDEYDGLYGVRNRDEDGTASGICIAGTDSRSS